MSIVASGQITLVDLNDSKQLVSYIGASRAKTVIHNPNNNTYVPNYATANQVLTPQLFIAGTNTDVASQAKSTRWFRQTNSAGALTEITASGGGYVLGTGAVKTLTINSNVLASATSMTYIVEMVYTDPDTGFDVITKSEIELVRVTNGERGTDGDNAITAILTNDSHIIPTDEDGDNGVYGGATTEIIVYNGTTNDSSNWTITATPSNGVTGSLSGRVYTVTNMTVDTGYVDFTATRSGYSTITKRFQLSKSKQGISGTSPTSYWLIADSPVLKKGRDGKYNPTTLTFEAKAQTGTGVPYSYNGKFLIEETTNGTTWTKKYESTTAESSYTLTPSANIRMVRVRLYLAIEAGLGGTSGLIDEQIINVVEDGQHGQHAITAILTNESHTIPTNALGGNGNYTNAKTEMVIYEGTTNVSASWTVTATASTGVSGSLSGKTYTVNSMTTDDGYVDLVATRSGYATITKRFILSKTKQGIGGESPTTYWLVNDAHAIAKAKNGVYTPASITLSAKSQTGEGAPANYSGRFRISESTNGTTFTVKYTSSANQATYTYPATGSFPSNLKAIKVELFRAGGTTTLLDEQIIPVLVDGTDGIDSVIATVWTPEGNTLKNSEGSLKATVTVYQGTSEVTPSAFKWYIQDPSATTSSGGDADGGNGWRLLNSTYNAGVTGYTTATITIPASAIASVESFKAVATYGGKKYQDVCTVIDVTDPIVVTIVGISTFKNGQGSTELTAKLYRNGAEIDSNGQDYLYKWSIYNSQNVKTSFSKTGKTITVSADDIDVRGNVICEVSGAVGT